MVQSNWDAMYTTGILQTRPIERYLEEAHLSGDLKLNARGLREFPNDGKYDLTDTVNADLSKNKLAEFPMEITKFWCLEKLNLSHNIIRGITDNVKLLQSLVYLDLSQNQLTSLPSCICELPLQILLVSHNKLQNFPYEIRYCKNLTQIDASCNQLTHLPPHFGQLTALRCLNLRKNLLLELPLEVTYLKLMRLDASENRIATLPTELRNMRSLEILNVSNNPLIAPPIVVCMRGRIHIFKWLELRCMESDGGKRDKKFERSSSVKYAGTALGKFDEDVTFTEEALNDLKLNRYYSDRNSKWRLNNNTPSPTETSLNAIASSTSSLAGNSTSSGEGNPKPISHSQTYKEYKESMRQQRTIDSVYRSKEGATTMKSTNSTPAASPVKTVKGNLPAPSLPTLKRVAPQPPIPPSLSGKPPEGKPVLEVRPTIQETKRTAHVQHMQIHHAPSNVNENDLKVGFTIGREFEKAKHETQLINELRSNVESRLKIVLPSDLRAALSDGVVLCHLANFVCPRSVASIHVPSPTVPKLSAVRARRNVDNFLEACRKIGVPSTTLCCASDILLESNAAADQLEGRHLVQLAITVAELAKFQTA